MIAAIFLGGPLLGDVTALALAACGAVALASACCHLARAIRGTA
jgi:hypothetical protein